MWCTFRLPLTATIGRPFSNARNSIQAANMKRVAQGRKPLGHIHKIARYTTSVGTSAAIGTTKTVAKVAGRTTKATARVIGGTFKKAYEAPLKNSTRTSGSNTTVDDSSVKYTESAPIDPTSGSDSTTFE